MNGVILFTNMLIYLRECKLKLHEGAEDYNAVEMEILKINRIAEETLHQPIYAN